MTLHRPRNDEDPGAADPGALEHTLPATGTDQVTDHRQGTARAGEALVCALELVALGYAIGPVSLSWDPIKGKKRARFHTRWEEDPDGITSDPARVKRWSLDLGCSFHIPTEPNGLLVIDLDEKAGGPANWRAMDGPRSPMVVRTQGGGEHHYFRAPAGDPIPSSSGVLAPGVDVRAAGGTVFAPGSFVHGGGFYVADRIAPVPHV